MKVCKSQRFLKLVATPYMNDSSDEEKGWVGSHREFCVNGMLNWLLSVG
jgi:hypothetical protein